MLPLWGEEVEKKVQEEARSIDEQNLPAEVKFCKKCVVSNQRPRIVFDDEGVCSACRFAEYKNNGIDWDARAEELEDLLGKHRNIMGYDCIVPCSGGKDSSFVAWTLKKEYNMNPLCVKWAPFMYTDIGRENFEEFSAHGFDTLEMRPSGLVHRKLARLSLEYLGEPFQPFIWGQLAYPMHIARDMGIKLVFFGENGEAEYGGDPSANDKPCWNQDDWERIYMKNSGVHRLLDIGADLGCFTSREVWEASEFYYLPDIDSQSSDFHWLGYYKKWVPQDNFYQAAENTGFKPNPERNEGTYSKYASIDDKLDGLHYYLAYLKFGLGRCNSDAAHEIRDGHIDREEAVALVERYDGEFPSKYSEEWMEYLGLTSRQLHMILKRFTHPNHANMLISK